MINCLLSDMVYRIKICMDVNVKYILFSVGVLHVSRAAGLNFLWKSDFSQFLYVSPVLILTVLPPMW